MKTTIIYLGIALVTFTNVISAIAQQSYINGESMEQAIQSNERLAQNTNYSHPDKRHNNKGKQVINMDPVTIAVPVLQKNMDEIIAEDNQITENTFPTELVSADNQLNFAIDAVPMANEKTIEETIAQDRQITESPVIDSVLQTSTVASKKP